MKLFIVLLLLPFKISTADDDEDIFTDYCQSGLCKYVGGDGQHSGCKNGVRHNGEFQRPPCPDNAALIPLSDAHKQYILDVHNIQRNFVACGGLSKHGLAPGCRHGVVTWDKELEKTAFLHTSYCTFQHDKCRNTVKYPLSGQNLGLLTYNVKPLSTSTYINVISYLWYVEYTYTKMDMINGFYHQTQWMVGHFLTLINERNNRVGCTFAQFYAEDRKKNVTMLSCNYPTTNINKGTIYNSCKIPASKCTSGTDPKYKYLCSSAEKYNVKGLLKHIAYDGDGSEEYEYCGREPELYHYEREGGNLVRQQHQATYPDKPLATEKPGGYATPPAASAVTTKAPAVASPEGNPQAGGIPDYSEDEYDPPYDSAAKLWEERTGPRQLPAKAQKFLSYLDFAGKLLFSVYFISAIFCSF